MIILASGLCSLNSLFQCIRPLCSLNSLFQLTQLFIPLELAITNSYNSLQSHLEVSSCLTNTCLPSTHQDQIKYNYVNLLTAAPYLYALFMHVQFKPHIKLSCMAYAIKPLDPLSVILNFENNPIKPSFVYLLHARTMQKERHLTHLLTLSLYFVPMDLN